LFVQEFLTVPEIDIKFAKIGKRVEKRGNTWDQYYKTFFTAAVNDLLTNKHFEVAFDTDSNNA
jgi:hypothetical protein